MTYLAVHHKIILYHSSTFMKVLFPLHVYLRLCMVCSNVWLSSLPEWMFIPSLFLKLFHFFISLHLLPPNSKVIYVIFESICTSSDREKYGFGLNTGEIKHLIADTTYNVLLIYFDPETLQWLKKPADSSEILIRRNFKKPCILIRTKIISRNF